MHFLPIPMNLRYSCKAIGHCGSFFAALISRREATKRDLSFNVRFSTKCQDKNARKRVPIEDKSISVATVTPGNNAATDCCTGKA